MCTVRAGEWKCERCSSKALAVFKYLVLLVVIVAINAFLIWKSLHDTDHIEEWDMVQGSDYVEVGLCQVTTHYMQSCKVSGHKSTDWQAGPAHCHPISMTARQHNMTLCRSKLTQILA